MSRNQKKSTAKQTVAAFMAAMSMITAPQQVKSIEVTSQNEVAGANKNATINRQQKNQGVQIDERTGGLDFAHTRMMAYPSPIYIPYYHTKQTYRAQARKAKNRRAAR
jgi:hypothetical protein